MKQSPLHTLKETLVGLLSGSCSHRQTNEIIAVCHAIACAYLKNTIIDGSTKQIYLGIQRNDVAYDCIADLFQKDEKGNFVKLQAFFSSLDIQSLSNQEILAHLRRIVSSRVNQGLFRIYQEADPSLGKILRNIKVSIQVVNNFDETERFGEIHISPIHCDISANLPTIDSQTLQKELSDYVNGSETIPQMLAKLSLFLREQKLYRRSIPLITVALAFRSLYSHDLKIKSSEQPEIENAMLINDASQILTEACKQIKIETEQKYLSKKKISPELFCEYFIAIEKNVGYTILGANGEDTSLFGALKDRIPELTPEQYRKQHKTKMEYLARLCKEEAIKRLKKNNL